MSIAQEEAGKKISGLVAKYQNLSDKERKDYTEADTRRNFVEPLFGALGWDIYNKAEVSEEEKASRGRVDYVFKLQGVSRFYLEAKALRIDLNKQEFTKQVTTYAYNKGTTWAILSNFEDLRVFNAQTGQGCLSLAYSDYLSKLDDLWLLSRESFEKNALDAWAETHGVLPPRLGIEQRLYEQLRLWREELFTQLHHYNEKLTFIQIDEVIQRFFNRLIFIRTSEDRQIENRVLLGAVHEWRSSGRKGELIQVLQRIFHEFDGYYDSDLFALHLVDQVYIESTTVENIITGLYDIPRTVASYDFSVIDADVLGAVYEQYLGHVATIAKQRVQEAQARMNLGIATEPVFELTAKKQHRKEQGIYYTPKFVTDYIVKETVGRFIQEHNHHDIMNMKILDPACGSGSFLIRAYDELLRYHADQRGKSVLELDQFERLPVLTGNIFGVDLDMQAVEIARLNLLLRSLARREMLPTLADNIRCGNSLISGTEKELESYFGDGWRGKKPFHWETEFEKIMAAGGFDVVIGNPPYVRIQTLPRDEADYYRKYYQSAFGSFDMYVLFLEQGIRLLKPGGRLGFITSGKFLKADYGKKIRQLLHEECTVESIVDLSAQQIFTDATTYPIVMIIRKGADGNSFKYTFVPGDIDLSKSHQLSDVAPIIASQTVMTKGIWPPLPANDALLSRLSKGTTLLGDVAERIFQGLKTSADSIYTLEPVENLERTTVVVTRSKKRFELENAMLKPLIKGGQMHRYHIDTPELVILFPYVDRQLLSPEELDQKYHQTWLYLLENRNELERRERGIFKGEQWYQYGRNQALDIMHLPKLITPDFAPSAQFSWDSNGQYCFNGGTAGGYGVILPMTVNPLYILGLLNSKLLDWYLHRISTTFRGGWFSYEARFIRHLPIRHINFNNPAEKNMHDNLVALVDKMLELNKHLAPIRDTPCNERDELQRQIEHTDREIDNLVYDLYGLTDTERKIIEESGSQASDNRGT